MNDSSDSKKIRLKSIINQLIILTPTHKWVNYPIISKFNDLYQILLHYRRTKSVHAEKGFQF
ncbi:hypothetical protein GCM10007931_09730 [Vibrio algivorus]|uniref:Uncharacterized protein n=1 Tax=Vibrio algivorus TaxID=1667024 RepID=A0ABQ6EMF8_9VIBR|nr:hypothetical protein GCM10007931_09730 [Vibrio algivorus]